MATVATATIHAMPLASPPRLKPAVLVVNELSEESRSSRRYPELNSASSFPTYCANSRSCKSPRRADDLWKLDYRGFLPAGILLPSRRLAVEFRFCAAVWRFSYPILPCCYARRSRLFSSPLAGFFVSHEALPERQHLLFVYPGLASSDSMIRRPSTNAGLSFLFHCSFTGPHRLGVARGQTVPGPCRARGRHRAPA